MSRRGLVVPSRFRVPVTLWALFLVQTAVIARWPGFFLDTFVDGTVGRLRGAIDRRLPGLRRSAGLAARLGAREVLVPMALGAALVLGRGRRSVSPAALITGSYLLVASLLVGLVSAALLWRQAHWLTDLVGGAILGLACLTTVDCASQAATAAALRRNAGRRPVACRG